jgi:hypothetical protein
VFSFESQHEYKQFPYTVVDGTYCLYFEGRIVITFPERDLLTQFLDVCYDAIERSKPMQDFRLHISGCGRCRRTLKGAKLDPCETGVPLFINGKRITQAVMQHMAESLLKEREAAGLGEAETESADVQRVPIHDGSVT